LQLNPLNLLHNLLHYLGAGFLSGSLGSYLSSPEHSKNMSEMIGNTARDAVVGGTISVIGGGKFHFAISTHFTSS
jgi:hypothetical protein